MDEKSVLEKFVNQLHVPIALGVLAATTIYHFYTHRDLGTNYVNSLYAFYGFLAGHFGFSQKWPDKSNDGDKS